jgi:hypothetical protein
LRGLDLRRCLIRLRLRPPLVRLRFRCSLDRLGRFKRRRREANRLVIGLDRDGIRGFLGRRWRVRLDHGRRLRLGKSLLDGEALVDPRRHCARLGLPPGDPFDQPRDCERKRHHPDDSRPRQVGKPGGHCDRYEEPCEGEKTKDRGRARQANGFPKRG